MPKKKEEKYNYKEYLKHRDEVRKKPIFKVSEKHREIVADFMDYLIAPRFKKGREKWTDAHLCITLNIEAKVRQFCEWIEMNQMNISPNKIQWADSGHRYKENKKK